MGTYKNWSHATLATADQVALDEVTGNQDSSTIYHWNWMGAIMNPIDMNLVIRGKLKWCLCSGEGHPASLVDVDRYWSFGSSSSSSVTLASVPWLRLRSCRRRARTAVIVCASVSAIPPRICEQVSRSDHEESQFDGGSG